MSIEGLSQELGIDFSADVRKKYLKELAEVGENYASPLGGPTGEAPLGRHLKELIEQLGDEEVELSPVLDVLSLREEDFINRGQTVPPKILELLHRYKFYLVHFPISLMPRAGWGFTDLDCIVEFNPGARSDERPVAFQVFPQEVWQDVIRARLGLSIELEESVGLDESFEFKLDPVPFAAISSELGAEARAALTGRVAGGAGLIVGPFDYHIWQPKIATSGCGHVKVRWRLEGERYVTGSTSRLGVVLQVPLAATRVDIIGVVRVGMHFHLFTAEVRHLVRYVREKARRYFEAGAPIVSSQRWMDVTAGV